MLKVGIEYEKDGKDWIKYNDTWFKVFPVKEVGHNHIRIKSPKGRLGCKIVDSGSRIEVDLNGDFLGYIYPNDEDWDLLRLGVDPVYNEWENGNGSLLSYEGWEDDPTAEEWRDDYKDSPYDFENKATTIPLALDNE